MGSARTTVVALYDREHAAQQAADAAVKAGAGAQYVSIVSEPSLEALRSGSGGRIPEDAARRYVEALRGGAHALLVDIDADRREEMADLLARFGPAELEGLTASERRRPVRLYPPVAHTT